MRTQNTRENLLISSVPIVHVICYSCAHNIEPKELQFVCPVCSKARNGKDGLSHRWDICRFEASRQDEDFSISNIDIEQEPYGKENMFALTVNLTGSPFGTISFRNVAVNVDDNWFLVSPEPLLA